MIGLLSPGTLFVLVYVDVPLAELLIGRFDLHVYVECSVLVLGCCFDLCFRL